MLDLATRVGSDVAPLSRDTTFHTVGTDEPLLACATILTLPVILVVRFTEACDDINAQGDYLW